MRTKTIFTIMMVVMVFGVAQARDYEATLTTMAESLDLTEDTVNPDITQPPTPAGPTVTTQDDDSPVPVATVREFLTWYLAGFERATGDERAVPLGLITGSMLDVIQADNTGPVLCTRERPLSVEVHAAGMSDDSARTVAYVSAPGRMIPQDVQIDLVRRDGRWLVDTIQCELSARTTAELVYTRYGHYIQQAQHADEPVERFADDWDFAWNRYLTGPFLERQIALNDTDLPVDPFFCAQDVPAYVHAETVAESNLEVTVAVSGFYPAGDDSYQRRLLLEAELLNTADGWKINVVSCVDP